MVLRHATDLPNTVPDPATKSRVGHIQWCQNLYNDPSLTLVDAVARSTKGHSNADSLVAQTLKTEATINAWQYFYRPGPDTVAEDKPTIPHFDPQEDADSAPPWAELQAIASLGTGLDGHPHLLHGGVVSFVMDEIMTMLGNLHRPDGKSAFTAMLKINYKKPVQTPCVVLAKCSLLPKSEGKKIWLSGTLEDGCGMVFATAECLVVEVDKERVNVKL